MNGFSYVVARDYGFAPNPFGQYCTLATCKPQIRESASKDDWIVGIGSKRHGQQNKMVFMMRVDEKLDYNTYYNSEQFSYKKPVLNGSLKQMYGDNIYHLDEDGRTWIQDNSHHSNEDGSPNQSNMDRDLKSSNVLISEKFWYFGSKAINFPSEYYSFCSIGRGYKRINDTDMNKLVEWISGLYIAGFHGYPQQFISFERYDGQR